MTYTEVWHEENTRYLTAALAAVRRPLEQRARANTSALPSGDAAEPGQRPRWFAWNKNLRDSSAPLLLDDKTQAADQATAAAPANLPPPALVAMRQRLGLTQFEQDILALCAATELDTSVAGLCARAQGDASRTQPTFALALSLFAAPAWDALSPERPLRYWRLIEVGHGSGQPLTVSKLSIDEWVLNYLKGLAYPDDRLAPMLSRLDVLPDAAVPPSHQQIADAILQRLDGVPEGGKIPVVQLAGADATSKRRVCAHVCAALGVEIYRLPWSLVPTTPPELETFARLWRRQSLLLPVALYLDLQGMETEGPQNAQASAIGRLLSEIGGLVFVDSREPWAALSGASMTVDVAKPSAAEQRAAWLAAVGDEGAQVAPKLAAQFNLNLDAIDEIARAAHTQSGDTQLPDRLWDACLAATRPRLDTLAQRIEPKVAWDDIVLPAPEFRLLNQIADQVGQRSQVYQDWGFDRKMSRGLGISALFAGDSGTGKTMAAEVLANHLRFNLYRIDLSAVVSKYIGETEKNLRRLFDAAEDGGAMLFFDEADALFGKRSEVKDSHDRYANIEINYLLQRMESFGGLAILATNQKSTLDQAFMRRLRFIVNFPFPGAAERKAIWQKAFPLQTPTKDLDFDRLSRLNLTGGHISLIALNAAFIAAKSGTDVSMPIVLEAARTEYRKLERPIHEPDFRWPSPAVRIA